MILRDPAAVRQADNEGSTALHWAARHDRAEVLSVLAAAGADLDAEDDRFRRGPGGAAAAELLARPRRLRDTPLHRAAYWGKAAVAQLLLAANAPLDVMNNKGPGPRHGGLAGSCARGCWSLG
eukprot:Skav202704  [mRNA]  locus=scaffold654:447435:449264:+ [translate_table: standard]